MALARKEVLRAKINLSWTAIARSPFHLSLRVAGADPFTVYLISELWKR